LKEACKITTLTNSLFPLDNLFQNRWLHNHGVELLTNSSRTGHKLRTECQDMPHVPQLNEACREKETQSDTLASNLSGLPYQTLGHITVPASEP